MPASVLIVDDEKNILLTLQQSLRLAGYHTELAASGQVALDVVSARPVDAVLMDVKMPDLDGMTALARLMELKPELPVIMMSGHGTIDTAVKATQLGARDFLEKPISRDKLLVALRNALKHQAVMEELRALRAELAATTWWAAARPCSASSRSSSARRPPRAGCSSPGRTARARS